MRSIWLILSMLALANILALGGVLSWLGATDRLNSERITKIREMLAKPAAVEAEELAAQAVAHTQAAEKAAEEEKLQRMLRRQREIDDLGSQLLRRQDELDRREKELVDRIATFEAQKSKYLEIEGTAQFQTALTTLEGLKAREAKATLEVLMTDGRNDEVIAYLAKMDERKRSGIMSEFAKEQPAVAADLLERLRTRGVTAAGAAEDNPRAEDTRPDAASSRPAS
jgi:hypothetical protein